MPGSSPASLNYPTIPNSMLWIDYANSYTDVAGTTPAADGNRVQTIRLPAGWGASLGSGMVEQTGAATLRPTWRTNGLEVNGTTTKMLLPATINVAGAFTCYVVYNFTSSYFFAACLSANFSTYGGAVLDVSTTNIRCFIGDASVVIARNAGASFSGLVLIRTRRTSTNNIHIGYSGGGDSASLGTLSHTFQLINFLMNGGSIPDYTSASVRTLHAVLVGADTVTAGTDAAIQAALVAKVPGLIGI